MISGLQTVEGVVIQFDPTAKLEINHRGDSWTEVTPLFFRSWGGGRRLNGRTYVGPVYLFMTNETETSPVKEETHQKITQ
jgi:hypothetical protein